MTFLYALATLWPKVKHRIAQTLLLTIFFVSYIVNNTQAQSAGERADAGLTGIVPLIVGQKVPDEFWSRKHLFYVNGDTVRKDLSEYKGKLLILDFWATWCGACRVNFPKLEQLKQKFGSEVNFILVNPQEYRDGIDKIKRAYDDFDRSGGSTLPTIILDEYIIALFPHLGIPRYVWINPKGRFTATTGNLFVDAQQITKILEGKY